MSLVAELDARGFLFRARELETALQELHTNPTVDTMQTVNCLFVRGMRALGQLEIEGRAINNG